MKTKILLLFTLLSILGCGSAPKVEESWLTEVSGSTTKIKVKTNLATKDLQSKFVERLLRARFTINMSGTGNPMETKMKKVENYNVRIRINFEDNTAILSGEYGNLGLNRPTDGQEPGEHHINWQEIKGGGKGWEILNAVSYLENSTREYNKIDYKK